MRREIITTTLIVFSSAILFAQTGPVRPHFEVASIKPSDSTDTQKAINVTPGFRGFKAENYSLRDLIKLGWDVRSFQISGGPGWLDSDRYYVDAKASLAPLDMKTPGNDGLHQLQLMVQSLLADRFKLKLHRETKEMRVYFLAVGKSGVNLKRTGEASGSSMHGGNGHFVATRIDMQMLARNLGGELGVPVLDKTDLNGAYDITLDWTPDEQAAAVSDTRPSLFTAVQEQLGLRLESGKGPVEVLVIDSAEKPSAN